MLLDVNANSSCPKTTTSPEDGNEQTHQLPFSSCNKWADTAIPVYVLNKFISCLTICLLDNKPLIFFDKYLLRYRGTALHYNILCGSIFSMYNQHSYPIWTKAWVLFLTMCIYKTALPFLLFMYRFLFCIHPPYYMNHHRSTLTT